MSRALEQMALSISTTWRALRDWVAGLGPNPLGWGGAVWLLVALLLVLLLWLALRPRRPRPTRAAGRPELLVSQGEIAPMQESRLWRVSMAVSNLNPYPVQLLELALTEKGSSLPLTADLDLLVPPHGSSRVELELDPLAADEGTLELFAYTAATRRRFWRLRAEFVWEPWNDRYKVDALRQKVRATRSLASARKRRERQEAWRRERLEPAGAPEPAATYPVADGFEGLVEPLAERPQGPMARAAARIGRGVRLPWTPLSPRTDGNGPVEEPDVPREERDEDDLRRPRERLEFPQDF